MFYDYVRALLGSPQALKNTKLKLLKQQSSLHLTHFYNKDIPRHVRTGEWPYIYGQKINTLPIWICNWNKGISLPKPLHFDGPKLVWGRLYFWQIHLYRPISKRVGWFSATSFHNQEMEGFFWRCLALFWKRRWTYPDLRSDEEKYSKYHHDMTIWTHFQSDS